MLVEAQQVEREQDRQERRLRGKERLQAKAVGGQIVLQLFNPLLDTSPPVVIAPQLQRTLAAVGQGLLQKRDHPACRARVAAAQPAVQNELGLRQYRQQRMMAVA